MLISCEYPFVDIRTFLSSETGVLRIPNWPYVIADSDFIRNNGMIRQRPNGGLPGWIGENPICEVKRAIRFLSSLRYYSSERSYSFNIAYRRLYFDGMTSGKYSLGIGRRNAFRNGLSLKESKDFFSQLFATKVIIPNPLNIENTPHSLLSISKELAHLYACSTVRTSYIAEQKDSWVKWITPIIIIIKSMNEKLKIPFPGRSTKPPSPLSNAYILSRHSMKEGGGNYPVWVIDYDPLLLNDFRMIRDIRIAITRLYSEYNSLLYILRCINNDALSFAHNSENAERLRNFLLHSYNVIKRKEGRLEELSETWTVEATRDFISILDPGFGDNISLKRLDLNINRLGVGIQLRRNIVKLADSVYVTNNYFGGINVEENYINNQGQVGSMGPGSSGSIVNERWENVDREELIKELSDLKSELRKRAKSTDDDNSVLQVGKAIEEAKKNNRQKMAKYLKAGGAWIVKIAEEVGTKLIVEILKGRI